ncbi:uncharacterized protein LOC111863799 isoform X7 [Cryptotermes secundus]|nr:uncharacterized protein LOC111863799 isoform X7 [Cryptotermes secundus]XP_033606993.1 uncharacterized protein LOC111863799 isoform X7 [Cryptotermes secundus]
MLVYTATRGQPRVPEQPSEWWASCTPRVILAQWKSVAYPQKLGTWKQVTVRRLISRGATEGKHVNWTELQIVPGTIVPYARTDRGEPRKTSFIQVAWRRTNSRSCRHTLRELNLRVSRLKTCSFVEADALLRPCVSSSAPPGAVQVWKRNLQGNTRCRTAWHLEL